MSKILNFDEEDKGRFDAAMVLGFSCVRATFVARVSAAASLYESRLCDKILLTGRRWGGLSQYTAEPQYLTGFEAVEMYKLAIELGIDDKDILVEGNSYNTLGNFLFSFEQFIVPFSWKRVCVISGPRHLQKAAGIISSLNFPDDISFVLYPCIENFSVPLIEDVILEKESSLNLQRSKAEIDVFRLADIHQHPYYKG